MELDRLREENRRLRMEREILKKRRLSSRTKRTEIRVHSDAQRGLAGDCDVQRAGSVPQRLLRADITCAESSVANEFSSTTATASAVVSDSARSPTAMPNASATKPNNSSSTESPGSRSTSLSHAGWQTSTTSCTPSSSKRGCPTHERQWMSQPGRKPVLQTFSRETELAQQYGLYVAAAWIGNSAAVAARHYLQVTDDDFARATAPLEKTVRKPVLLAQTTHGWTQSTMRGPG